MIQPGIFSRFGQPVHFFRFKPDNLLLSAAKFSGYNQRYTYRVLQTIQMKLIPLWVWAEQTVLGRAKTALKFKYEI